jgi:hypothetical protein
MHHKRRLCHDSSIYRNQALVHRMIAHSAKLDVCVVAVALFIVPPPKLKAMPNSFTGFLV